MTDTDIIDMYFARDQRAVEETQKRYGGYCYSIAQRMLDNKEDSEECVNDALLSAWNSIPPNRPKYLNLFLAKLTRNRALDRIKVENAKKRGGSEVNLIYEELSECIGDGRDIESELMAKELSQAVNDFTSELPEREGDILIRRYFFMESVKDIAEEYDMTPGNVSVSLNRTRAKLRKYLEANGYI